MNENMKRNGLGMLVWLAAGVLMSGTSMLALDLTETRKQLESGKSASAIAALKAELDTNPANEPARILLAEAFESADQLDKAVEVWEQLKLLTSDDQNLRTARRAIARIRRIQLDQLDIGNLQNEGPTEDPFKIDMPEIDWEGLEVVEETRYLPPILASPYNFEVPPFVHETQHFSVYSTNERLSRVIGERAELYLEFMLEKLFGGRSWAVRFPILVYRDASDYQQHGGPENTGGVTIPHITGKTQVIILYQLRSSSGGRSGRGSSGATVWKYGIESVLPHELTHAVINEFFGGQQIPQWLHEAVAGRFEQTRDHYGEAARLARKVVAGEYFRIRDLFEQDGYPERISLFYEQSAAVVLYLFEAGPDAMYSFLAELRDGNDHDAACAAALGIPKEGAVEEFERRWIEWMKVRYIKDLNDSVDGTIKTDGAILQDRIFLPWVNELDTVANLSTWRDVDLSSLDAFRGVGPSKEVWSTSANALRGNNTDGRPSFLGIRMNEQPPCALQCDVRAMSAPAAGKPWFGVAQLDTQGYDTRARVRGFLKPGSTHKITVVWSDDLSIYVDDTCVGRVPALLNEADQRDVDYPLAIMAGAPVEVQNLRVAPIKTFSDKPVVAQGGSEQPPDRSRRRNRRGP